MVSYENLELLIDSYNTSEAETPDEFLDNLRNDTRFRNLTPEEKIQLKRRFWGWIQAQEYDYYDEQSSEAAFRKERPESPETDRTEDRNAFRTEKVRHRKRYVEAFINNISVPKTLEELSDHYLNGNDAQMLVDQVMNDGWTEWTSPRWAKRGDIVLFMHAKAAKSYLTAIRTQLRSVGSPDSTVVKQCESAIEQQLKFHRQFGGKIYAVGRVSGAPKKEDINAGMHYKSRVFCEIDRLFLLENPIDISEFNSFIKINSMGAITPVFGREYERLKDLISQNNQVPYYFINSFSTPFPHNVVNRHNWMKLGQEYRLSFTLEIQFRQCYVNYLLKELGDQKTIYMECPCYKGSNPITYVDNVIRIGRKLLPVEVKLNIELENDLKGQCEQYCRLDKLVLDKNTMRIARMENVINDQVLVIDTYAVYMFHSDTRNLELLYDLGDLRTEEDICFLRKLVLNKIGV